MAETEAVTFEAPTELVEAAHVICRAFNINMDTYMTDALDAAIECGVSNNFIEETEDIRQGIVDRVKVILGERA